MSQPEVARGLCHSLNSLEGFVTALSGSNIMLHPYNARRLCDSLKWIEGYVTD